MNALEPILRQRLLEFRSRRALLLAVKGGVAAVLIAVGIGLLLVAIDAQWILSESTRGWMALGLYAAMAAVVARLAIIPSLRGRSLTWLASRFEEAEPRLKNRLLAAIELSDAAEASETLNPGSLNRSPLDSIEFRRAVQRSAARRIEPIEVASVLPWRLVKRWMWMGAATIAVVVALCAIPDLHLANRLGRVLLPSANLGRVSKFSIQILLPKSPNLLVAEENSVPIQAILRGGTPKEVRLETESLSGGELQRVPMIVDASATADSLFQIHWMPPLGKTRYRVVAEDAMSAWYQVDVRSRPKVDQFVIEYRYPEYTREAPKTIQSDLGNLDGLVGTMSLVTIVPNQKLSEGEVRVSANDRSLLLDDLEQRIPLKRSDDDRWTVEIPIQRDATYRVELVADETNFENTYSPKYSIHATIDQEPTVRWTSPLESSLAVQANEWLDLAVSVEDELPVVSLTQQIKIGTGAWTDQPIPIGELAKQDVAINMDLGLLKVQSGDLLQTRLVVTDRMGQSSTSSTLELFVSSMSLSPERQSRMKTRVEIAHQIDMFYERLDQKSKALRELYQQWKAKPDEEGLQQRWIDASRELTAMARSESEPLRQLIARALPKMDDSVSASELESIAQNFARLETEAIAGIEGLTKQAIDQPLDVKKMSLIKDPIERLVQQVNQVSRHTRDLVTHDVLSQIGQDMHVLWQNQMELRESVPSMLAEQYRRRQMLVARHMQDLSTMIREQVPILKNRSERTANQWADWLDNQARKIDEVTGSETRPRPPQESVSARERSALQFEQELQQRQNSGNIDSGSAQEQIRARKELRESTTEASRILDRLSKATQQLKEPKKAEAAEYEIVHQWMPALEQLAMRREIQQARHDGDNQFVADLGEAYRAARSVVQERGSDWKATAAKLGELQTAMKTLEAVHELYQAAKTLDQLHATERWKSNSLDARFEQPRVWDAYRQQMSQSIQSLVNAKLPEDIVSAFRKLEQIDAVQRIDSKIGPRRWTTTPTASASQDVEELQRQLREQMLLLAEFAKEARIKLAQQTPSVPQLARKAAEETRLGSEETKRVSEAMKNNEVPELAPRLSQLQRSLEGGDPSLRSLREALADVASRQDLMQQSDANVARDADASIAITRDLEQRIDESMEQIAAASNVAEASSELEKSIDVQDRAAESLEKIANHFESISGQASEATTSTAAREASMPGELAESAKEIAQPSELNQAHDDAERLRRLASLDPKRVLEQLEKELVRNQPMRTELSEIAEDAMEGALQTLDFTAQRESELNVALEDSDVEFSKRKELMRADIDRITGAVRAIADKLAPRVEAVADQVQAGESKKDVERLRLELSKALALSEAVESDASMEQMRDSAQELEVQLDFFQRGMARQAVAMDIAANEPSSMNENQYRGRLRAMEELQSRYREEDVKSGFSIERTQQQEASLADQERKKAQRDIDQRKKDLENSERAAAAYDPTSDEERAKIQSLQQTIENQRRQLKMAEAEQRLAVQKQTAAEARQQAAKTSREQLQMSELKPLVAPDPGKELTSRTALDAVKAAQAAIEALRQTLGEAERIELPKAAQQALEDATIDQEGLRAGIASAAESLARAARHEERLTTPQGNDRIEEQAAQVAAIANDSMRKAQDQLAAAASHAQKNSPSEPPQADGPETSQSQQALRDAEQALRSQATTLRTTLHPSEAAEGSKSSSNSPSSPPPGVGKKNSLLSPQEMAKMLDELDQQLNSPPQEVQSPESSQQKSTNSTQSKSQQASKSSSAGDPSDSSADERAQTLADAAQRLAAEMNQQRKAMESAPKSMPESGAPDSQSRTETRPGISSSGIVMPVEIENFEDWGKLREQSADSALEGGREQMLPAYRQQIEEYFRILSRRRGSSPSTP